MEQEDEESGLTLYGSDFNEKPLCEMRVAASGRCYRVPIPNKKVISLEDDCDLLLLDPIYRMTKKRREKFFGDPLKSDL